MAHCVLPPPPSIGPGYTLHHCAMVHKNKTNILSGHCGIAVIASAYGAKGLGFNPGWRQFFFQEKKMEKFT